MKDTILKITLILLLALVGYLLFDSHKQSDETQLDLYELADALIDSGLSPSYVGEETLLLEERKLISTGNVNSHFSRELITKLQLLNSLSTEEPIDLYLRTEGGWEADIFSVIDVIQNLEAKVNIHALGEVHSAGIMLLAAASGERIVYPHTILGFHTLSKDEDEIYQERYRKFWKEHAKIPQQWLERKDDEMIYFTPEEALKYQVADRFNRGLENR